MSDLFGIDAGTYQLWQSKDVGGPLTRERLYAAIAQMVERSWAARQPFNPILPKSLENQLATMEKAK